MSNTYWKCTNEGCVDEHIYNFKGLCRSCTIYDEGKVSEPIPRVKVTESGSLVVVHKHTHSSVRGPLTRQEKKELSAQVRSEKKHQVMMRRAKRMLRDNDVPEEHRGALVAMVSESIGESVGESVHVHDENCNHEEE